MNADGKNEKDGNDEKYVPAHMAPSLAPHHSLSSHLSHPTPSAIPPRGNYHTLLSFQKAEVVYDLTFRFAHKFLAKGDRTIDQMIQAARSGKKNILEGSKAGRTSKETEIKLTNVARASLEELLDDYLDFLRARDLRFGARSRRRRCTCAISVESRASNSKTYASLWRPARRRRSRTSRSASSTRPTTSSTNSSAGSTESSSSKAVCASA